MENTLTKEKSLSSIGAFICLAFAGALLISLSSLGRIPFYPVAFTLQTFAIALIALTQAPKQAFASVIAYLLLATCGLPVLAGKCNSLWMLGASGGYLIAFPVAAYVSAKLAKKMHSLLALTVGQALIYALGFVWLSFFVGPKVAFYKGVVLFVPSDILKNMAAVYLVKGFHKVKERCLQ